MKYIQSDKYRPFLAALCAMGWSLAYPFIKLGYAELQIVADDLGSKVLFAGIRFFVAGILVLLLGAIMKKDLRVKGLDCAKWLILFAIVNTTLHYLFSYIGLSYLPSSRSIILDSMGGFMLIILSSIVFHDDNFGWNKIAGCILGISGILLINIAPAEELLAGISFRGDGFILLNACCTALGGLLTRVISKKMNIIAATGYGMGFGGLILIVVGLLIGIENPWNLTAKGIGIIFILIMISAVCFGIYNLLLAYHPISKVASYNAFIPILGVMFSSVILGEPIRIQYILAGGVVATGVWLVNHSKEEKTVLRYKKRVVRS